MRTRVRIPLFLLLAAPLAAASLPAPEAVFGFRPGADYKLATYNQSVDYFKRIAASSRLVRLLEAGPTTEGARCTSPWCRRRTTCRRSIAIARSRGASRTRRD